MRCCFLLQKELLNFSKAVFASQKFVDRFENDKNAVIVNVGTCFEARPQLELSKEVVVDSKFVFFAKESRQATDLFERATAHDLLDQKVDESHLERVFVVVEAFKPFKIEGSDFVDDERVSFLR